MKSPWPEIRLKFVCRLQYGEALPLETRESDGPVPVFGSNGVFGQHSSANTLAPAIIVGRKGSFGSVSYSELPSWCIDTAYWIDSKSSKNDLRWLYYALQTLGLDKFSQDTGVPGLSREVAYNYVVPYAPFDKQIAIADFLDRETAEADDLVAKYERLIELLEEKRVALITQAVTKGLDPNVPMKDSGVEWIGEIPSHWQIGFLKRFASRVVVGIAEAATHAYSIDGGVPILRSTNIRANKIKGDILRVIADFAKERESKKIFAGDLITVRTGNAGVTAVIPPSLDGCQCFTMLITSLKKSNDSTFFSYALNSSYCQHVFALEAWGTAQANISVPILQNVQIAVPPPDEQRAIVANIQINAELIDSQLEKCRQAISYSLERRSALITAAITGQIDVSKYKSRGVEVVA